MFNALKPYGSEGATAAQVATDVGKKRRVVAHHIGKLIDAGRVRVRNTKPAPHYAICDGVFDVASTTTHNNSSVCEDEQDDENSVASIASVASGKNSGMPGNAGNGLATLAIWKNVEKSIAGNAGNAGNSNNEGHHIANPPPVRLLTKRILDALQHAAGAGVAPGDLIRMAGGKAGAALADAEINRLLLEGRIGRCNGRLVATG